MQMMGMEAGELSAEEITELEAFLMSEEAGLEGPMDASMIDGFFCALISAPQYLSPTQALRWVYDSDAGEQEPVFDSMAQAQRIMGLLMRQWNAVASALMAGSFEPLIPVREHDGREVPIIDEWCSGYCIGMKPDLAAWEALITEHTTWFETLLRYGTEAGWDLLERSPPSDAEHQAAADGLGAQAQLIHGYWLERRAPPTSYSAATAPRRAGPKVGRNEACPCGSGKKYKHCHGAN